MGFTDNISAQIQILYYLVCQWRQQIIYNEIES